MEKDFSKLYLENQLCFPLYAASRLTTQIYAPFLKEPDLTYPQYLVLLVLWQQDGQSVNEIGSRLLLESNTLTPLLKRLEQKGLIERKRAEEDERSVRVFLNDKSRELREQAVLIPDKMMASFVGSSVSSEELQAFQKILFKLLKVLKT